MISMTDPTSNDTLIIREAGESDLADVLAIERTAFGSQEEANLVRDLLKDDSAQPTLSLIAILHGQPVGHLLFSKLQFDPESSMTACLLAPLAVVPEFQNRGIGSKLIKEGIKQLKESGTGLIFVLGHPAYYPRFGFKPAMPYGFNAPYPIPEKDSDAWMVMSLDSVIINTGMLTVICADSLMKPELWRE
jgi:putative acetyltransferase